MGDKENDFLEPYIRYARLAPSAINAQPVMFEMAGNAVHVYRKKPHFSKLEKMQRIDTGIALSHIFMYAREQGYHIDYFKDSNTGNDRYIYFISLNILEDSNE